MDTVKNRNVEIRGLGIPKKTELSTVPVERLRDTQGGMGYLNAKIRTRREWNAEGKSIKS